MRLGHLSTPDYSSYTPDWLQVRFLMHEGSQVVLALCAHLAHADAMGKLNGVCPLQVFEAVGLCSPRGASKQEQDEWLAFLLLLDEGQLKNKVWLG